MTTTTAPDVGLPALPLGHVSMIAKEASFADELLEKADAQGLRNVLKAAHKRENEIVGAMMTVCGLYADKEVQRRPGDPDSIAAMRDVALAAINLATRAFDGPTEPTAAPS